MNRVGELLEQKGMSQKELAITMGLAQPSISAWVTQKSDPARRNLQKLAEIFGVDRSYIICNDAPQQPQEWNVEYPDGVAMRRDMSGYRSVPRPAPQGLTDEDLLKIAEYVSSHHPELGESHTIEAKILSEGVDRMPKEARERAVEVMKLVFAEYASYFERNDDDEA